MPADRSDGCVTECEVRRIRGVYEGYYAESHQDRWDVSNPGNEAISKERSMLLMRMLRKEGYLPLTGRRILEVGCGSGAVLASLLSWGAQSDDLFGVDLRPDCIEAARAMYPELTLLHANAEDLPFIDASFDLVLLFTVFTSILHQDMAANISAEVRRVLKPGGAIVWYDFRYDNPTNPNVRGYGRRRIARAFPGFKTRLRSLTLLPPLARSLGTLTPWLYPALARIPLLRTHYLGVLVKPS